MLIEIVLNFQDNKNQKTGIEIYGDQIKREFKRRDVKIIERHKFSGNFILKLFILIFSLYLDKFYKRKENVDLFLGYSHYLPFLLPRKEVSALIIHDVSWQKSSTSLPIYRYFREKFLFTPSLRRADIIIAVSQSTAKDLSHLFPWCKENVHVVHPGPRNFATGSKHSVTNIRSDLYMSKAYALFVGTVEPRKNLNNLLHAIAISKSTAAKARKLLIAGGKGWRHAEVNTLIDKYGLSDCVQALGYVSDSELAALYSGARFLAMPSLYEGFGLPIIEAGSFGVPALTSNVSSMPEAAGKAGLFVDPHNPHDIARGWQRLWNDDDLYNELRSHARENAARFSWSKTVDEMLALFRDVIEQHRQSHPR